MLRSSSCSATFRRLTIKSDIAPRLAEAAVCVGSRSRDAAFSRARRFDCVRREKRSSLRSARNIFLWNVVLNNQLGPFCNISRVAAEELCIIGISVAITSHLELQAELAVPGQVDENTGL